MLISDQAVLGEYEWALRQVRHCQGEVKKWVLYAGQQLEISGFDKEKISAKLRNDLPDLSADYISQICKPMGWTDKRFAPEVENAQPQISSSDIGETLDETSDYVNENKPYLDHLQNKIDFLREVQQKLKNKPFMSLIDKQQYEEYAFLADNAEKLARQAWDNRQTIPVATQFYLAEIVAISTIKHGASEYVSKVKELFALSSKQVTKTLRGVVHEVHYLYEPTNKMEALLDGFYGRPCQKCKSWRVIWDNGISRCCRCQDERRVVAEKLPLARISAEWTN